MPKRNENPLWLTVEAEGAEWTFGAGDKGFARLAAMRDELKAYSGTEGEVDSGQLSAEIVEAICAFFTDGIRGWAGLVVYGEEVPFKLALARDIPTELKIAAVAALFERRQEIAGKEPSGPEQPTSSSLPPTQSEDEVLPVGLRLVGDDPADG